MTTPEPPLRALEPYPRDDAPQSLSTVVQRRLAETGWTLTAVATRAGLSVATVSAIANGTRGKRPRPTTLARLAEGLGLPEDDLLRLVRRRLDADSPARHR